MTMKNDEVRETVDAVMRRDRRRIRILAGITIALWIAAFFVLPALYMPAAAKVKMTLATFMHPAADAPPLSAQELAEKIAPVIGGVMLVGLVIMAAGLLVEVLAAISTVALVLTIRRVTMRQVNTHLAEISEQLARINRPST